MRRGASSTSRDAADPWEHRTGDLLDGTNVENNFVSWSLQSSRPAHMAVDTTRRADFLGTRRRYPQFPQRHLAGQC